MNPKKVMQKIKQLIMQKGQLYYINSLIYYIISYAKSYAEC